MIDNKLMSSLIAKKTDSIDVARQNWIETLVDIEI